MNITASMPMADLAIVIALALVLGKLSAMVGQPSVIGEILAGILMGPTLLHGSVARDLFPTTARPFLTSVSNFALILFIFVVGIGIDHGEQRRNGRVITFVSLGATLLPFGLGALLALALAPRYATGDRLGFVLFLGAALSVTAFPVLARIVDDRGLTATYVGQLALSVAAICDLVSWTTLALIQSTVGSAGVQWQVVLIVPFSMLLFVVGKPLIRRMIVSGRVVEAAGLGTTRFAILMIGLLGSAAFAQAIGLHYVFGAFLYAMIIPRDLSPALISDLARRLHLGALLLPVYFVEAGFDVNLSNIGWIGVATLAAVVGVAVAGKFVGTWVSARAAGLSRDSSAVVAILMNTRGLTELIVLTIGLQIGVLSVQLYSIMVLMALITTAMSGPLLNRLVRGRWSELSSDDVTDGRPVTAAFRSV